MTTKLNLTQEFARFVELDKNRTQGDWKCDKNEGCKSIKGNKRNAYNKQGQYDKIAHTDGIHEETDLANAQFFASSPSIFKALQVAMEIIEKQREALFKTQEEWPDWDSIRSAIAFADQYLGGGNDKK